MSNKVNKTFSKNLLNWHKLDNKRTMPWKNEKNAYKIWLSEIILQQTRVEQGLNYYLKFISCYPTVIDLANSKDDDVFKLWEGLGYYSRCKNLLFTARIIRDKYNGIFPNKYEDILALKGVGTYTAAAIASFAFSLPYAVLDGNVYRVLSRVFGIKTPIDLPSAKNEFISLAQKLLDKKEPALFNQAMMDLGATICKPKQPLCDLCCFQKNCFAYANNKVNEYPIKNKKIKLVERYLNFLLICYEDKVLISKREEKDIWQNLHQFFLFETQEILDIDRVELNKKVKEALQFDFSIKSTSKLYKQKLTHRLIKGCFIEIEVKNKLHLNNFFWIDKKDISKYSFPKFINMYFQDGFLK